MTPRPGDLWVADLNPVRGHERGGIRPCLVVSTDEYNRMPIDMVMTVPLTSRDRKLRHHPRVEPEGNALKTVSFALPEYFRAITTERFHRPLGRVRDRELAEVRRVLRLFIEP